MPILADFKISLQYCLMRSGVIFQNFPLRVQSRSFSQCARPSSLPGACHFFSEKGAPPDTSLHDEIETFQFIFSYVTAEK